MSNFFIIISAHHYFAIAVVACIFSETPYLVQFQSYVTDGPDMYPNDNHTVPNFFAVAYAVDDTMAQAQTQGILGLGLKA